MDWTEILKDVGIVGVISGLITWLIKQLGESYLTKNAKIHQHKQSFENVKKAEKIGIEFLNYYSRNKLYLQF